MRAQLTKLEELKYRRIVNIDTDDGPTKLVFDDGTFAFIDWLDDEGKNGIVKEDIRPEDCIAKDVELGILSLDEYQKAKEEQKRREQADFEAGERRRYEQLKAKYG